MKNDDQSQNVAILGASENPERYSFKALQNLISKGHHALPINPNLEKILGHKCYNSIQEIIDSEIAVDTLTLYVNAEISSNLEEIILTLHPKRVIFNPGAENKELKQALSSQGIECIEVCTLVMLSTNQFS